MKLIVGLGNPGRKYIGTRHNVGFEVIAELARRYDVGRAKAKFNGELAETIIKNQKSVLLTPLTYMNLSGQSVRAAIDFYKLEYEDLLVVCDDLNLPLGRLRMRPSGSAGGQNGIKDIIQKLGDQSFSRLRLGIDRPPPEWDAANYVLGRFSEEEQGTIEKAIKTAADAVEVWIAEGIQKCMTRFNSDPEKKKQQKKKQVEKSDDTDAPTDQDKTATKTNIENSEENERG